MKNKFIWGFIAFILGLTSAAGINAFFRDWPAKGNQATENLVLGLVCALLCILVIRKLLKPRHRPAFRPNTSQSHPVPRNKMQNIPPPVKSEAATAMKKWQVK